jgi:hypothetical protein
VRFVAAIGALMLGLLMFLTFSASMQGGYRLYGGISLAQSFADLYLFHRLVKG